MAWKEKWTQASASGDVQVSRQCEFCGFAYQVTRHVEAAADTHPFNAAQYLPGGDNPSERVKYLVDKQVNKHQQDPTVGALCPQCNRFSSAFMRRHFPKGFREGLLDAARKSNNAGCGCGCLVPTVFCLSMAIFMLIIPEPSVVGAGIMGLLGVVGIIVFVKSTRGDTPNLLQLRDQLARLTDEQVYDIVLKEHHRYEKQPHVPFLDVDAEEGEIRGWAERNRDALRARSKPVS